MKRRQFITLLGGTEHVGPFEHGAIPNSPLSE
jgi:hypothetical protein